MKAYIKKIMSQLNKWMAGGKISKLVVVITSRETGEHVERWQFDVRHFVGTTSSADRNPRSKYLASKPESHPLGRHLIVKMLPQGMPHFLVFKLSCY